MPKVAVVLSGCGHKDGAEIREAVLALLALDKQDATVTIFAPNIAQRDVVNHLTGEPTNESRNVLVEAARIARGTIQDLKSAKAESFDALVLPGGFGAAKNLSDLAIKGKDCTVLPELKNFILGFMKAEKPIGAICIAPAVLAAAVRGNTTKGKAHVTLGDEKEGALIEALDGIHHPCPTRGIVIDDANHIVSTPAYMREARLAEVAVVIEQLVAAVLTQVAARKSVA